MDYQNFIKQPEDILNNDQFRISEYLCTQCDKKQAKLHTMGDDQAFCNDCFEDAEARVENAFDVAREEGRI